MRSSGEEGTAPVVSVVVPAYNGARYLAGTLDSLLGQTLRELEVLVVDDASVDGTRELVRARAAADPRLRLLAQSENGGTLAARKRGVLATRGELVTLVDQDDELVPEALERLVAAARLLPGDVWHFGVRVDAATEAAAGAAAGMEGFLTPEPRALAGEDILRAQFAETGGFDWHVHHKLYRGELARRAYSLAADERLLLSDDLYMSFVICSLAHAYRALPNSAWYVYHLGRGETLGAGLTVDALATLAERDAKGLELVRRFAEGPAAPARDDWPERVADVRDRLAEHVMNEWKDNLAEADKPAGLEAVRACWPADALCAELWRYVRDYAYELLQAPDRESERARSAREAAERYLAWARELEGGRAILASDDARYHAMREVAMSHLRDTGLVAPERPESERSASERPAGGCDVPAPFGSVALLVRRLVSRIRKPVSK